MTASGNRRSTTKKKSTGTRSKASKKTTGSKASGKVVSKGTNELLKKEIIEWAAIAVGVILELCNFGVGKTAGNAIAGVFFGICGLWNYVFPLLLIVLVLFLVVNKGQGLAVIKIVFAVIGSFMICTFIQLVSGPFDPETKLLEYYFSSSTNRNGGGIIGGAFTKLLCTPFGKPISYVIVIIVLIICVVIVSEKSLIRGIKNGGEKAYSKARENAQVRNEKHREAQEERRIQYEAEMAERAEQERIAQQEEEELRIRYEAELAAMAERERLEKEQREKERIAREAEEERRIMYGFGMSGDYADGREAVETGVNRTEKDPYINQGRGVIPMSETELNPHRDSSKLNGSSELAGDVSRKEIEIPLRDALYSSKNVKRNISDEDNQEFNVLKQSSVSGKTEGMSTEPEKTYTVTGNEAKSDVQNGKISDSDDTRKSVMVNLSNKDYYDINGYIEPDQFVVNKTSKLSESDPYGLDSTGLKSAGSDSARLKSSVLDSNGIKSAGLDSTDLDSASGQSPVPERKKRITKETRQETAEAMQQVEEEINEAQSVPISYMFPPVELLKEAPKSAGMTGTALRQTADKLVSTLESFGVHTHLINVSCGPSVTRYELAPETGVKVSKIVSLADDIKLNLAASDIRIEAPIPGKAAVGIEVPNSENTTVTLRELIESPEFINHKSKIAFAVGLDLGGKPVITDIFKMPHLLIGGATGSGKSVCINTLIMSILYKAKPDEVKFIMIDPKMIELNVYNGIPHLYIPVVTDPKKAAGALQWAVAEMTKRYTLFSTLGVRDLKGFNAKIEKMKDDPNGAVYQKLPQIVIVVDEFADLMMVASGEVEEAVCRLAQLARAAGIHLILATQRPSVDVITGLIKANMPSRLALAVSSGVDSRTIIDMNGAEKLLGRGDMLFAPSGLPKPIRVQGAFVTDQEVEKVVDFVKNQNGDAVYDEAIANEVEAHATARDVKKVTADAIPTEDDDGRDAYFKDAARFIVDKEKASIGSLQRAFKIGFNRAARIMDQLCEAGIVGEEEGTKPRKILMNMTQLENYLNPDAEAVLYDVEGEEE